MTTIFNKNDIEKVPAKLTCESCGKDFLCGANLGECWCFTVELTAESLTNLREKFKNCLCGECLNKAEHISAI